LKYSVGILRCDGGFDRNKVPDNILDLDSPELFDSDVEPEEDEGMTLLTSCCCCFLGHVIDIFFKKSIDLSQF
jgi:hypothetical protein